MYDMSMWGLLGDGSMTVRVKDRMSLEQVLADREKSYIKFECMLKQADRDHCHLMARIVDICDNLDDYVHEIKHDVKQYIKEISRSYR